MYHLAIVDDNASWCFVLETLLQQHGYVVSTFTDTSTFLRAAHQFDLVLIDFSMPPRRYQMETDGPDIIRKVRQRLSHPPLMVLISSYFTDDCLDPNSVVEWQADACWSKQIPSAKLLQQIEELIQTRFPSVRTYPDDIQQNTQQNTQQSSQQRQISNHC